MKRILESIDTAAAGLLAGRGHAAARLAAALLMATLLIAAVTMLPATSLAGTDDNAALEAYASEKTPVEPGDTVTTPAPLTPLSTAPVQTFLNDTAMPTVVNLTPAHGSFTGPMPIMSYEYFDPSGVIWPDGVHLFIDNRCSRTMPGPTTITSTRLTYTPAAPLPEGPHVLEGFLCDRAFNCGSIFWNITVDATAPVVGPGLPTGTINTSTATVAANYSDGSGSGIATSSVHVHVDGDDVTAACAIDASGFTCNLDGLDDGNHSVNVSVPDMAGNTASRGWNFLVDTATIGITGQQPAPGSWQTSATPLLGVDFQPAPTGAINLSEVTILLDGADISDAATITGSGFLYMSGTPLGEGLHTIRVSVNDDAGHAGESEWIFYTDSTPPVIAGQDPVGNAGSRQPHISATFSDSGSGINQASARLMIDDRDETVSASVNQYGMVFTAHDDLAPGTHTAKVSVSDFAGNNQTSAWSFDVPAPPPLLLTRPFTPITSIVMRQAGGWYSGPASFGFFSTGPARWNLTGFQSWPSTWYLPWHDSRPAGQTPGGELLIRNLGAGEAWATVLIGNEEKWSGKLAEGSEETIRLENAGSGPLRVVCPTGQRLDVRQRAGSGGQVIEAILQEDLDTTWYLPYLGIHDGDGTSQSQIVIANAGEESAEVDVYVGDPTLPESLKGHLAIPAGSATLADLPGVNGGMARVSSTNNQPLLVSQRTLYRGALSETLGVNRNTLARHLRLDELPAAPENGDAWLLIANPTESDVKVEVNTGVGRLRDGGNDFHTIPAHGFISIRLDGVSGPLNVDTLGSPFGIGVVASVQSSGPGSFSEQVLTAEE